MCKKYNKIKLTKDNKEIDLYNIISNSSSPVYKLMNKIVRGIKKNGKKSFMNNSYFLINMVYIYCMAINQQNYNNYMLNKKIISKHIYILYHLIFIKF